MIYEIFSSITSKSCRPGLPFQQCYQGSFAYGVKSDGYTYSTATLAGVTCHLSVSPQTTVIFPAMFQMKDDRVSSGQADLTSMGKIKTLLLKLYNLLSNTKI